MLQEKLDTLKTYLLNNGETAGAELEGLTVENCCDENNNTFEVIGNKYKVLTANEADEAAAKEIKNSLWAFDADFIISHAKTGDLSTYEYDILVEALQKMRSDLCEAANPLVMALIDDIDDFISDAMSEDGRGHFLSFYDGMENEENGFYIYRIN